MSLDVATQKFLELERNKKYQWIACVFSLLVFVANGFVFYWLPRFFRSKRYVKTNRFKPYFVFVDAWDTFNAAVSIRLGKRVLYFRPSLLALSICFILLNGKLCYIDTLDLDYKPRIFIIGKRCARIGLGQMPALFLAATKGDFITAMTGLTYQRAIYFHTWLSILMFLLVTAHVGIVGYYWARPAFDIAPKYPKNVYGIIGYACFVFLTFANVAIIRKYAFDFLMVNHRVHSFIMLLMAFLHNDKSKAMIIVGIHLLVLDKVLGRIYGILHSRKSPTKGYAEFEILDEDTLRATVPVKTNKTNPNPWYRLFLFKYGTWLAGLHVYLNVRKIDFFQHHPFAVASLPSSGNMTLIIKKKNGFTKKLYDKVKEIRDEQLEKGVDQDLPDHKRPDEPTIVKLKASFRGPSLGKFQPLITFDSVAFFAQDCGASFVLPLCLDLLQTIEKKEALKDYLGRPPHPYVRLYWAVNKSSDVLWYEFMIKKLLPFINSGKLDLHVFVKNGDVELEEVKTQLVDSKSKKMSEIISVYSDSLSIGNSSISNSCIKFAYAQQMDVASLLESHIASMHFPEQRSFTTLAVMSCGLGKFGNEVEEETRKYTWVKGAPNIYFYNESYDS
ncbi:Ferric reductase transmembrane component 1 [Candida viswanathii]|uniref:Ferric reductase transmembrane component 1 n=1 Tax=Candida viswanathii TaxID=5486 RepID=A0A367YK48_9ASCO|nr:Ferric reductase transmembrane component 1 [Candida viswanathii]